MIENIIIIAASTCSNPSVFTITTTDATEVLQYPESGQIEAMPEQLSNSKHSDVR